MSPAVVQPPSPAAALPLRPATPGAPFARARLSFSAKDARRARAASLPHHNDAQLLADLRRDAAEPPPRAQRVRRKQESDSRHEIERAPPQSPSAAAAVSPAAPMPNVRNGTQMDEQAVRALEAAGYAVVCELSDGSFGAVYRATRLRDGLDVAAKAVRRDRLTAEELLAVRSQSSTLATLRHKHLVTLVEAFEHPAYIFHVFEFLHGGDLFDRLEARGRPFAEADALSLAAQMLRAVGYLHARRAAHRDIKLENFVFATVPSARSQVLKLIDFDLLLVRGRDAPPGATCTDMCGTVLYVPPELAAAREYVPEEADMWAVGVVLYVLLCFEMPFQGRAPRDILREVRNAAPSFAGAAWRRVSRRSRELVESLLSKSGAARPSAEEALARVEAIAMGSGVAPRVSLRYIGARWRAQRRRRREDARVCAPPEVERASQDELDGLLCYEAAVYDRDGIGAQRVVGSQCRSESEDTMLALQKMRQAHLNKSIPMGRVLGSGNSNTVGPSPKRGVSESGLRKYWIPRRKYGRFGSSNPMMTGYC